jgi:hypothetical protein
VWPDLRDQLAVEQAQHHRLFDILQLQWEKMAPSY